jgi:SIR2-like protein
MLRTDLIDILNSGLAWAFVGSGVSADAGCPTWKGLVEATVASFEAEMRSKITNDDLYELAFSKDEFAACFSRIQSFVGRRKLEAAVVEVINRTSEPGDLIKRLADLPFAGYTTTNYDNLLESQFQTEKGWSSVGNLDQEIRKVSGGATRIIWHIHGSAQMKGKSRLILTEKDYDDFYLEETPAVTQLRGLLTHHRIVFVGFSFKDPEVNRLLKRIGRLCHPARPIYAFLSGVAGPQHESTRKEFLQKYNVDIIPYRVIAGSHDQLRNLLDVYGALVLRRSLKFGLPARACPSYDPETTGLLIYNELVLRGTAKPTHDILAALLKARILALLKYRGSVTTSDLFADLDAHANVLHDSRNSSVTVGPEIGAALRELETVGLIRITEEVVQRIELLPKGSDLVDNQSSTAERLSDQFVASLAARTFEAFPKDVAAARRVSDAAELFLKDCLEQRALGVAMARHARGSDYQAYHLVALLQTLPKYMEQLLSPEEAITLSKLVRGILANPSEAEASYIGLVLQAQFGVHLLGYEPNTLRARARDFSNTLFLLDSSTLIPYIARSSMGNSASILLMNRIRAVGSVLATTTLLSHEVTEHAQWAVARGVSDSGYLTTDALQAATGRAGDRSNAFIEGFVREKSDGQVEDFSDYLSQACQLPPGTKNIRDFEVQDLLNREEIFCNTFSDWEGFTDELYAERDELSDQIAELREANKTFRHWRQVKAEAEALVVIRSLRNASFTFKGKALSNAFFISHTRVIDHVARVGLPVTMRPEAALQWVAALTPCTIQELSFLTNSLLAELSERNLNIVDKSRMELAFYTLTSASRDRLDEVTNRNRVLISEQFGEDAANAFREISALDAPFVLDNFQVQRVEELERQVAFEQRQRIAAQTGAKLSEKERQEYDRLRAEAMLRKTRARSNLRKGASKKKRRKNKGKKK